MKPNIQKTLFLVGLILTGTTGKAQMGVGTLSPGTANAVEVNTTEKFIIDKAGQIGVGVAAPKVAIDLRNSVNGSMAIGMTDQTAVAAGSGAMRYNPSPAIGVKGFIEYSDGNVWIPIYPYGKPRIVVMAEKTNNNTSVFEAGTYPIGDYTTGIPGRSSTYLTSWAEKLDSDSGQDKTNFDPATGEFIAPRAGVYFATFTFALAPANVNNNSGDNQTEATWEVRNSSDVVIQRIKTNNGYPQDSGGGTSNNVIVGSACTVSVSLNAGDKLRPFVWIDVAFNSDAPRPLQNTGGYNVLTIVEQ